MQTIKDCLRSENRPLTLPACRTRQSFPLVCHEPLSPRPAEPHFLPDPARRSPWLFSAPGRGSRGLCTLLREAGLCARNRVEALQHLMERGGRGVGSLPWLAQLVRPLPPGFTLPGIFCPSEGPLFPRGVIYSDLSDFYSVLLNKMSVIVYICVSGIADHRAKLSYTAVVFSVNAGRSEACSGR